ncbi:hypothetical protein [Streptacidiphilus sp. MAP12-16]|uniref:hypothetical protein n=1 Tax=Streptacidiphilus sp. MAP12-16 TaxID=3156300 RepID=UPI003514ACF9
MPALTLAAATSAQADASQGLVAQNRPMGTQTPPGTDTLPLPADTQLTRAQQSALNSARTTAISSGRTVVVDALSTQTSSVSVLASGRLIYNASVLPTRVKHGKSWVPIDTTLKAVPGGGFAPAASPGQVAFSGGGAQPLVTMTAPGGVSLALTWPTRLPTPTANGSTLTFPSVLPSVDLQVTATTVGGFTETLVVKSAAAATNPALASLTLGTQAHGVKVTSDGHGNLNATTPIGQVIFHAPAPAMWDSSTTPTAPATKTAGTMRTAATPVNPAPAIASTPTTPGSAAKVAAVADRVHGSTITLVPDKSLLTNKATKYPLFVDPTWTALWTTGYKQHFAEVQEGCSTAQNFDSTTYGNPGVGDNTFTGCIGIERAYYQLGIPSTIYGATVHKATFNLQETYSASCSVSDSINLRWAGAIGTTTSWRNQPGSSYLTSANIGPACTSQPSTGFDITSTIGSAATNRWPDLTFGVFNSTESDSTYFKRFVTNPTLSIEYDHAPGQPWSWNASVTGNDLGCATSAPYPPLGKFDSTSSITLSNRVYDADGDSTQTAYHWWVDGSSTQQTGLSVNGVANWGTATTGIPHSFIANLPEGTVVDWRVAWTSDGDLYTYPPSSTICHFAVYQTSPSIKVAPGTIGTENTPSTFTASSTLSTDPAAKFVYSLDVPPPSSNAPANETVTASGGSATITTVPMGAGSHTLYVIGYDAAGNATPTYPLQFNVQATAGHTYATLKDAFNNTGVSDQANTAGANLDGSGYSLSLQALQAAGWASTTKGQSVPVTIDGATFTNLAPYGNGLHDNVLADNQTINFPSGSQGEAVVVLATGTFAGAPYQGTDAASLVSPYTPPGSGISGTDCTHSLVTCNGATGTINYANGTTGNYSLAVPDWGSVGNTGLAALTMGQENTTTTANISRPTNLYAFAIHLKSSLQLSSITLPDVSGPANPGTTSATDPTNITGNPLGAPISGIPSLHILGIAVRNATTDTAGNTWTGAWSAPAENQYAYTGGTHFTNQTWRTALTPSVSGTGVRIHLSNQQSKTPLTITHLTVATQSAVASSATTVAGGNTITTPGFSPVAAAAPATATFGTTNATSVTIPAGGDLYSNPVTGQTVTANTPLLVSAAVADATTVEGHQWATGAHTWITAAGAGDQTTATTGSAFTATGSLSSDSVNIISGLDTITTGNQKTVAVLGDGLVGPYTSGNKAATTASGPRLSEALANALAGQSTVPAYGIVNTGIENNSLNIDSGGNSGLAALSRLDRDILSEPGLQTVVIDQGLVDATTITGSSPQSVDTMATAYLNLQYQLTAWGIKVVYAAMTPCGAYNTCATTAEAARRTLNGEMTKNWPSKTPGQLVTVVGEDTDAAVSNDTTTIPEVLKTSDPGGTFDSGDHINLTPYASATMAQAGNFTLSDLTPSLVPAPAASLTLVYDWAMNDGTGTTATDGTTDLNLALTGTTWPTDPSILTADPSQANSNPTGTVLGFNGTTSVATPSAGNAPEMQTDKSYEIDAWVKLTALTSTDQWVLSQSSSTNNNQVLSLGYSGTSKDWTLTTRTSANTLVTTTGTAAVAGSWTRLRVTYNQPTGGLTLYVNGVAVGVSTNTAPAFDSAGTFSLGAATTTGSTTLTGPFQGSLSHIQISA